MLSLPLVLHEAERHAVDEIVIEPGHPVTFHGEQGALVLGDELAEASISDALSLVLAPEQQAELAVAGIVEFYVEGHAEWSLVAETGSDGVVVRGRLRNGATPDAVGVPLELPPLDPFEPEGGELPHATISALRQSHARSTRWDMNLAGSVLEPITPTGSGALDDTTLPPRQGLGRHETGHELPPRPGGSPLDDEGVDFALVGPTLPSVELLEEPERAATMPRLAAARPTLHGNDSPAVRPTLHGNDSPAVRPTLHGNDSPAARPTLRANDSLAARPTLRANDSLAPHVEALAPGTLVYLAGIGMGERLLQHLDDGFELIDLDSWDVAITRPFEELPDPGRGYLVRLEDPSRCLAWILRRLEEGARIVVETRARTAAGARRALLGSEATPHVVEWLDAHPQLWLHANGRTWLLERV